MSLSELRSLQAISDLQGYCPQRSRQMLMIFEQLEKLGTCEESLFDVMGNDRFIDISNIGKGSFGTVYRAFDLLFGCNVALKVSFIADPEESILQRSIKSDYVVRVYDIIEGIKASIIIMELMDGDLTFLVQETDTFEGKKGISLLHRMTRDVLLGLRDCHRENIIHRDIKPDNIMYKIDKNGNISYKLSDFGLSHKNNKMEVFLETGTPGYVSPEQLFHARKIDWFKADAWALGITLYEAYFGVTYSDGIDYEEDRLIVYRHIMCSENKLEIDIRGSKAYHLSIAKEQANTWLKGANKYGCPFLDQKSTVTGSKRIEEIGDEFVSFLKRFLRLHDRISIEDACGEMKKFHRTSRKMKE